MDLAERTGFPEREDTDMCEWYDVCPQRHCDGRGRIRNKRHFSQQKNSRYQSARCYSHRKRELIVRHFTQISDYPREMPLVRHPARTKGDY